jgi:hypothetical protein
MNIPGFTAEASVYKTPGNYQMAGTPNDLAGNRGVVPQISDLCGHTAAKCLYYTHANLNFPIADMWCGMHEVFCLAGDYE